QAMVERVVLALAISERSEDARLPRLHQAEKPARHYRPEIILGVTPPGGHNTHHLKTIKQSDRADSLLEAAEQAGPGIHQLLRLRQLGQHLLVLLPPDLDGVSERMLLGHDALVDLDAVLEVALVFHDACEVQVSRRVGVQLQEMARVEAVR